MAIFNTVYGWEWSWKPWANTIAYYPLTSSTTVNDMKWSGTAYNLTSKWTSPTFWTYWWVSCAYFSSSWMLYNNSWTWTALWNYTISIWYNKTDNPPQDNGSICWLWVWWINFGYAVALYWKTRPTSTQWVYWFHNATSQSYVWPYSISWWTNIVIVANWSSWKLYINWVQQWSTFTIWSSTPNYIAISRYQSGDTLDRSIRWYMSEFIMENKVRTADEVAKYYNSTKANYS